MKFFLILIILITGSHTFAERAPTIGEPIVEDTSLENETIRGDQAQEIYEHLPDNSLSCHEIMDIEDEHICTKENSHYKCEESGHPFTGFAYECIAKN